MLVAAAVCPCPPLLVPEVASGAAGELDAARDACADALGVLAVSRPDLLVVVGPAGSAGSAGSAGPAGSEDPAGQDGTGTYPRGSAGSFRGLGVGLGVSLGTTAEGGRAGAAGRELPQSLAVGAWLLSRTPWADAPVEGLGVGERLASGRCADEGRKLAARAERVALLVLGDGSACRTLKAPGYLDERADGFDAAAARALGAADTAALLALDEHVAYELKAAGRAPWQVLAGAAEGAGLGGRLLYEEAPYGVGYFVAAWS